MINVFKKNSILEKNGLKNCRPKVKKKSKILAETFEVSLKVNDSLDRKKLRLEVYKISNFL